MNSRIQSYGMLLATLLIGVLLGFLINGQIVRNRMDKAKSVLQDRGGRIEKIFDKMDLPDAKREEIRPVFEAHFQKMRGMHREFRSEVRKEMSVFKSALSEHLTAEQLQQLEAEMRLSRRKNPRKPGHEGRHRRMPPPTEEGRQE